MIQSSFQHDYPKKETVYRKLFHNTVAEEDGKEEETMPCIFKSTHDNGFVQFRLFTVKKNKQKHHKVGA